MCIRDSARRALEVADHGYIMEQGRIVLEGSAQELRENPDVKEFYLGLGDSGTVSYTHLDVYKRQNVSSPAAQVAKDIKAGNLDMKIVCLNWCADELFVKTAGADNAEGHVMIQPFAPSSVGKEGSKVIDDYLKTKGSSLDAKGLHYAQGWYTCLLYTSRCV